MDDFLGAFDIPEQHIVEQAEESLTFGGASYETGKIDTQAEEPWDPLAGILG